MNTGVLAFAPPLLEAEWLTLIRKAEVEVLVAPADLLLAMKLNAARGVRDGRDIEVLLERCGVSSLDQAEEIFEQHYPGEGLSAKAEGAVMRFLARPPTDEEI